MSDRRHFIRSAAAAGLTTNIFPKLARGANDKIQVGYIGMGAMGLGNLKVSLGTENIVPTAVCDVYQPYLVRAKAEADKNRAGAKVRMVKDFREIIADKSIDAICISTPDHWHAYMTIEGCKAGKDVYVEKPCSVTIEEGQMMVKAARKYSRVVQAGTMQRSAPHFIKACEIVRSGELGQISFCRTWNYANNDPALHGSPADSAPPKDLDWDMWLGPAPQRAFNENRWGVSPKRWSTFRYFWDYAGGWVTDWAVHLVDIVQMAFNEPLPTSAAALGGRYFVKDNTETPDTLSITLEYPNGMLVSYENRQNNANSLFNHAYGITFHGSKATLFVDRSGYQIWPEKDSAVAAVEVKGVGAGNDQHWANFADCIKTRKKPNADIEYNHKTSTACHLGTISYRSKMRVDFDPATEQIAQVEARKFASRENRAPWKLTL